MLWALGVIFRREFALACILMALQIAAQLVSPYGLRHLLMYLESGGEGAIVRPWVWVLTVSGFWFSIYEEIWAD